MKRQELQVAALQNGTVIDHIPSNKLFEVVNLLHLENVKTAVTVGGRTYTVPEDVACYNSAAKSWLTLSQAHGYADTANLYVSDGVVRVIEVGK